MTTQLHTTHSTRTTLSLTVRAMRSDASGGAPQREDQREAPAQGADGGDHHHRALQGGASRGSDGERHRGGAFARLPP
jgi:hypothetical protein